ncbi:LysR family transcriptional regulator [Salipiger mangrovisoli]|uniref:LysR family transcriptional regulator n=1 Tax=Salipiger mangrovisoli TaxID=2865933 RepID=A0ABR9X434_9RHOB|nr:LysR family transcriptional regulator [Salipiger mangrovisoli]MBE9638353.1 LysR family transcriptional regulator [Salipiger mangrovisoli]
MTRDIDTHALVQRLMSRGKFRHMQALIRLCDLRSMGRAAEAMGITQPGMSQLCSELERLVGLPLFLRHSRGVDPTELARDLEQVARRIVTAVEESAETIVLRRDFDATLVRVATTVAAAGGLLHDLLPLFVHRHRSVQVQLSEVMGMGQEAALASGEIDLLCCRSPEVLPDGWSFLPCRVDQMVVIAAANHPLARKARISSDDLASALWLPNHISTLARHEFERLAREHGFEKAPQARVVSRQMALSWMLLREGTMITLMPRSVALPWIVTGQIVVLPTGIDAPLAPLGLVWDPARAQRATRTFVDFITAQSRPQDSAPATDRTAE